MGRASFAAEHDGNDLGLEESYQALHFTSHNGLLGLLLAVDTLNSQES